MSVFMVFSTMKADTWPKIGRSREFYSKELTASKIAEVQPKSSIIYPYDERTSFGSKVVTLTEPGTLAEVISEDQKYSITDLTVKGPLNGSDIRFLREMCGVDVNNKSTEGKLVSIDFKDAIFVEGGAWYVQAWQDYLFTSDSPNFPSYSFAWLKKLERIRFPQYCYNLTKGSLLQCQGLKEILLPCGTTSLDYNSLNGGYENMPLTELWLPSSFSNFDVSVYRCKKLTDIYCFATTPPVVSHPSEFISQTNISNGTLYVPKGCANAYWRAKGWQSFKEIKEVLDIYSTLYVEIGENGILKYNGETLRKTNEVNYAGCRAFEVPIDETIKIQIIPDEGYIVSNVSLNNEKVTYDDVSQSISVSKFDNCSKLEVEFSEAPNAVLPSGISLSHDSFYMLKGDIRKITATVLPEDASDKSVRWTTSDESVASVDMNGIVFALGWGTAEITAYTSNNLSAKCNIVVTPSIVEPTGITLSDDVLNMHNGEIMKVTATVSPENATDKTVTWIVADESIATVDMNGIVIAKALGTTEITAYTSNNLSAKCKVVVTASDTGIKTNWEGHYKVSSEKYEYYPTRDYPDNFEMDIEKVGNDWYVTSLFGNNLKQYNDGGFKLTDNGDGTASVDILNNGILQYTNKEHPLYAVYVFDEETDDWADTWEFKMNENGTLSIEDFYVVGLTWSEVDQIWKNAKLEVFYYDVKAKTNNSEDDPSDERLDIFFTGSMTDWDCLDEWKFDSYDNSKYVYNFKCAPGQQITLSDIFLILTKDWTTVLYGVNPGSMSIKLNEITKLCAGLESWTCSLDTEWNGICWLDIETGTIVFSNDPDYVAPFANSAVGNIYEESNEAEEYYDLKGQKVDKTCLGSGIYIVRKGSQSKKVMVK